MFFPCFLMCAWNTVGPMCACACAGAPSMGRARKKVPCGRVLSATPWRATQARPSERARAAALRQNGSRIHCARCALRSLPQDTVRRGATEGRASVYVVPPSVCLSYYKICLRRRGGFPCLSLALRSSRPVWSFFRSSRPLRSLFRSSRPVLFSKLPTGAEFFFRNSRPVRFILSKLPTGTEFCVRNSRPVRVRLREDTRKHAWQSGHARHDHTSRSAHAQLAQCRLLHRTLAADLCAAKLLAGSLSRKRDCTVAQARLHGAMTNPHY